jgi:hypothetical protein
MMDLEKQLVGPLGEGGQLRVHAQKLTAVT